jgi:hypothetical protein
VLATGVGDPVGMRHVLVTRVGDPVGMRNALAAEAIKSPAKPTRNMLSDYQQFPPDLQLTSSILLDPTNAL